MKVSDLVGLFVLIAMLAAIFIGFYVSGSGHVFWGFIVVLIFVYNWSWSNIGGTMSDEV